MCSFASFVDFPFFFWKVSCEKGFSPFLILIFALGAKVSKCISESFGRSVFLVELARTEVSSEETFLPSSKDQPSESRAMRDRYPLVKKIISVWVSTG